MRHATLLELAERDGTGCPTRWSRTGRPSSRRPTRRAGSASSGSTTWPGRCCAPRTTYAGWCARPPRTTSRDGGRWLEIQVDPSGYAARFGGITAFTDLVLDAVREASRDVGLGMAVVIAANRTRHPLDARTLARLAGAVRRPRRGRLRALQRRAARLDRATSRRRFRIAERAGLLLVPHGGELLGPEHVRVCLDDAARPAARPRRPRRRGPRPARPDRRRRHRARGLPGLQRRARASTPTSPRCRCPTLMEAGATDRARRRRPAAVRLPAGRPVRHDARRPRPHRRAAGRAGAVVGPRLAGRRRTDKQRWLGEIDEWLGTMAP